jgi:hypothetical protein
MKALRKNNCKMLTAIITGCFIGIFKSLFGFRTRKFYAWFIKQQVIYSKNIPARP